ncbi:MAG: hypothetical protein WCI94_09715 [Rhodospirillales bacterium]
MRQRGCDLPPDGFCNTRRRSIGSQTEQLGRDRRDRAYAEWAFGVMAVDPALLDDTSERMNIAQLTLHATAA